ncbi:hypothetical protein BJF78_13515 [Pseudonocardia sp. CNS-139]|nr:hypothetical protein BJF78_13515 [Pseudonocardia sp. CNS-139]
MDLDWAEWLRRYDAQQELYVPDRERRFALMIDLVGAAVPEGSTVVDVGAGPGALSTRLLARLPSLTAVALDADPVMLEFGRRAADALGTGVTDRLRWLRADVVDEDWRAAVREAAPGPVHAVVSATALHYLPAADLVRVYREIARLLPRGGCFVSGDVLLLATHLVRAQAVIDQVRERREQTARDNGAEDWGQWWDAFERAASRDPALAAAFAERARSSLLARKQQRMVGSAFHLAALDEAGFAEVTTVWQDLEEFVLLAVR